MGTISYLTVKRGETGNISRHSSHDRGQQSVDGEYNPCVVVNVTGAEVS